MDGQVEHYADFYGLAELPDEPLTLVSGNCQAESLRLVLEGGPLTTVRIPPVHELVAGDVAHLHRLLARTAVLVTQPVRDDYRGLPIGAGQLAAALPAGAQVVRVPVIRFAGLYPAHAIVRPPRDPSLVPPVVAYHDLRRLAAAAGRRLAPLGPAAVRAVAEHSLVQLRLRERAHDTVEISDAFAQPEFGLMRTLNHPGNPIWLTLAARVRARLGLPEDVRDPGRPLLNAIHAPREPAVIEAFGLGDEPQADWLVDGEVVPEAAVAEAHAAFYAANPDVVEAGLRRHADVLDLLAGA